MPRRWARSFADADDYHSATNKTKMAAGHPLDDSDRQPWLETLNALLRGWHAEGTIGVLACSALKASYRTTLSTGMSTGMSTGTLTFCLLDIPREVLERRRLERRHEFMNAKLLDSQLATLELPKNAIVVKNDRTLEEIMTEILKKFQVKER